MNSLLPSTTRIGRRRITNYTRRSCLSRIAIIRALQSFNIVWPSIGTVPWSLTFCFIPSILGGVSSGWIPGLPSVVLPPWRGISPRTVFGPASRFMWHVPVIRSIFRFMHCWQRMQREIAASWLSILLRWPTILPSVGRRCCITCFFICENTFFILFRQNLSTILKANLIEPGPQWHHVTPQPLSFCDHNCKDVRSRCCSFISRRKGITPNLRRHRISIRLYAKERVTWWQHL